MYGQFMMHGQQNIKLFSSDDDQTYEYMAPTVVSDRGMSLENGSLFRSQL